jgi:hypothetical protein
MNSCHGLGESTALATAPKDLLGECTIVHC